MKTRIISFSYLLIILALFFYSFTQVDLSLTLSRVSIWQNIQKSFQYIGYFNRPLSTAIFLMIVLGMFSYYLYFLKKSLNKKFVNKDFFILIILTTLILVISYTAFSYDIFNYIFDAKIITHYHQNPYIHKALDYPGDPMLSFMHWTHRVYPYGPIWLVLTVPISFIGSNIFLMTYFLFKILIGGFYLGSVYLISKINKKINPENPYFNLIFFALNPLVIIESLVSSHNDIAMIFFALLGIYLMTVNKKIFGIVLIVISALIKIPTAALLLPGLLNIIPIRKLKLENSKFYLSVALISVLGIIYSMTKLEIQPWYFLWALPFIALLRPNKYIISLSIGISAGLLLRYSVFLFYGNWDGIAIFQRNLISLTMSILPIPLVFIYDIIKKSRWT